MKILEKIIAKQKDKFGADSVTIVCLGDSVTQGCFGCYKNAENRIATLYDGKSSYSARLRELFGLLYPTVQVNIVNSGISGGWSRNGAARLESDVLSFHPDLVIVSYGLNDSNKDMDGIEAYIGSLRSIFERVKQSGAEIIFLTQNYMCTEVSPFLADDDMKNLAKALAERQNRGVLKAYFERAKALCKEYGVEVCDLYAVWEKMEKGGVATTELLANYLNHPIREYHYYVAVKLMEKILGV